MARDPGSARGSLLIIGGGEDREHDRLILRTLAKLVGSGCLVVATLATREPGASWQEYRRIFHDLGMKAVKHLHIEHRDEAADDKHLAVLADASAVFFTGGDQLRITSKIGGTPVNARIQEIYAKGGVIAGTSAGASVMSDTMLVAAGNRGSAHVGGDIIMAPGLGLAQNMIIDQHFAERGRIRRLLAAVAQNPRLLGIGIDEDTAIRLHGRQFQVIGSGAVYVLDGHGVTNTNISEGNRDDVMSLFDARLHVLTQADVFDMVANRPQARPAETYEPRAA